MVYDFWTGFVIGAVGFSVLFAFLIWFFGRMLANKMFDRWVKERLGREITKSLDLQRPIIKGKISEQMFPLLYQKVGDLSDFRFIGNPIDYIVFDGLSKARDNIDKKVTIKFIELKTGRSALNKAENLVKDAVEHGRVGWEEIQLQDL
jgi:predicted Holliday junction resolvase-like endonuclease